MSGHIWRPVIVVIALVGILIIVRELYVPGDFGVHARGYTYGWYRERSVLDWQWFKVKYEGTETCRECHRQEATDILDMPHASIQCQNCHGPALDHPTDPKKLTIDRSRDLCLRCHTRLPYPSSARGGLRGIDPEEHNPGKACIECHLPHQPTLETGPGGPGGPQMSATCRPCHQEQVDEIVGMPHQIIYCERCHGAAGDHPTDPPKLKIDTARKLCLKCHADKTLHNQGRVCVTCHDPHRSSLEFLQFVPRSEEAAE